MSIDRRDVLDSRSEALHGRGYRYYVFVDEERMRGFDDEASALMNYDEEILLAQHSANENNEAYTVSVVDELTTGKDAIVAMHICTPKPVAPALTRALLGDAPATTHKRLSMRRLNKERA